MAKKRKRCRHPCECGWRIRWTARFRREAQEMGVWSSIKYELKDIEKRLRNPQTRDAMLEWLESQYSPYDVVYKHRRFTGRRIYVGRQTARAIYVVRRDICRVWFVAIRPARKKYKRRTVRA